jgi:hypothetical protein
MSICTKVYNIHKNINFKYKQIIYNNKTMTNNIKYHCNIYVILMNKNMEIKILKNTNGQDIYTQVYNTYKLKKNDYIQKKQ